MSKKSSERRGQERAPVAIEIDLETYDQYYLSKLRDVSIGGAFVQTRNLQPLGASVKLRFILPGQKAPIETTASVVWVYDQPGEREPNSSGMGVEFTDIQPEDQKKIAAYIQSRRIED